ncbi:MAG: folate-binding protein [Burkholderiales bacterium]|nr:MAG: folate-binding protein [Burkholderiales bacterium]
MLAAPSPVFDDAPARAAIEACGAAFAIDAYGPQARRCDVDATLALLRSGAVAPLPDHGLLALTGDDRVRFLHSMTTNDVERQPDDQARWHGLCTPKGRLLATMLAWRDDAAIHLMLPRPQAEPVRKRLSMYMLRAKVRIEDRSDALAVLGLCGEGAAAALAGLGLPVPAAFAVAQAPIGADPPVRATIIGLPAIGGFTGAAGDAAATASPDASASVPAAGLPRWLLVAPAGSLPVLWARLSGRLQPIDSATWRWTDVRSGVARIVPATAEQFVPQMINFDTVGGVSFDKGCYPGQEIVARSHYLGKVKRRVFLGHLAGPEPAPGAPVTGDGPEPVGVVVVAAPAPGGGVDLLFEARVAAVAQSAGLQVDRQPLRVDALPYALPTGE